MTRQTKRERFQDWATTIAGFVGGILLASALGFELDWTLLIALVIGGAVGGAGGRAIGRAIMHRR